MNKLWLTTRQPENFVFPAKVRREKSVWVCGKKNSEMEPFFEIRLLPGKGRSVFARKDFARDSILEKAPIIKIPEEDWRIIEKTCLHNYAFGWGQEQDQAAIALGWGSLFNHSYEPNAFYLKNLLEETIDFIALRDIRSGEEITVNYSGHPYGKLPLWFQTV